MNGFPPILKAICRHLPSKQVTIRTVIRSLLVAHTTRVLTGHDYHWVPDANGSVPPGAVSCGLTSLGEPLYVGRPYHANSLTPGKVHPSQGCLYIVLYIGFGGEEVALTNYEVLVRN